MKITAIEEYGLRCMILLAKNGANASITLPEFMKHEGLSLAYAGKLLMILKHAGLVRAVRGRKGGYRLTKSPEKILLREIFDALGEPLFPSTYSVRHSGDSRVCVNEADCRVRDIWRNIDNFIGQLFDRITLEDVASGRLEVLEAVNAPMRNILMSTDEEMILSGGPDKTTD